jgi:ferredoxin
MQLKTFRRWTQGVTFALFLALFFLAVYPYPGKVPVDIILRLDPLVTVATMLASRAVITAIFWGGLVLLLSLLAGRFFCGYVCPLGTLIDVLDFLMFKKHKREDPLPKPNRNIKYFVLAGVLVAALLGLNLLHFFSPMAITPRFFALALFPPLLWLGNLGLDLLRPLFYAAGLDNLAQVSMHRWYFENSIASLLLLMFIAIANFWRRRFWCRYVCPSGALISLVSRYGLFKRRVSDDRCTECKRCAMACDMRAIGPSPKTTVLAECTLCGDCTAECPRDGIALVPRVKQGGGNDFAVHVSRRNFMYASVTGLACASVAKQGLNSPKNLNDRFIRPPGSVPEDKFLSRCIRCGECMKVCKTNGLQPALFECGIDGLWTPHLVSRHGGCEDKCHMCGQVCPTDAIRQLPLEEKKFVKLGTAVIDKFRCIAWEQKKLCLICDEICPVDAIEMKIVDNFDGPFKRPFVTARKCTGCGLCENKCPVAGRSAIEVFSIGEERISTGSYITEEKKKMRVVKNEEAGGGYSSDAMGGGGESATGIPSGFTTSGPAAKTPGTPAAPEPPEELPSGFTN